MNETITTLINEAPERFSKIATLWAHSTNYEYPTPATLFLDLIGYSLEEYGELFCQDMNVVITRLGYTELGVLGEALDEYATRPDDAIQFVQSLLDAEVEEV